ncbi:MAG: alpha/beta hydrolase, partial [Schaalia odontolytica]
MDTADHVGVIVPGLHTNVEKTLSDYDNRAGLMRENALRQAKRGETVAMVEYLGYDAPQVELEAASSTYAENGARELSGFLNGVDASREHGAGDAHITLMGHSYGSTTSGMAATLVNKGVVDDIVLAGSPGAGVQNVSEYHVPQGHAWVSAAPYAYDMVQGLGTDFNFGKNPDTMAGFKHLSGDVGPAPKNWDPVGLHMAYFDDNTQAQS